MQTLERLLDEFQASFEDSASMVGVVQQIEAVCMEALKYEDGDRDAQAHAQMLFTSEEPPSLLMLLLQGLRTHDQFIITAKVHACKFVELYVKKYGVSIEPYALEIVRKCWELFRKETHSNEVRAAALRPLNAVFRQRLPTLPAEEVNLCRKLDTLLETL
jgi:hypothetical protein